TTSECKSSTAASRTYIVRLDGRAGLHDRRLRLQLRDVARHHLLHALLRGRGDEVLPLLEQLPERPHEARARGQIEQLGQPQAEDEEVLDALPANVVLHELDQVLPAPSP